MRSRPGIFGLALGLPLVFALPATVSSQAAANADPGAAPRLHHAHLNSVDPEAAIEAYRRIWPDGRRGTVAGHPAFIAEMSLLFNRVDRPPPGGWDSGLQRSEPQSALWHIGGFVDTTDRFEALEARGVDVLRLEPGPGQGPGVVRSGLTPYAGIATEQQLSGAEEADPREGGFGYLVGPDGGLVELTGSRQTSAAFAHVHLFHEQPRCAANWYVDVLGFSHAPGRDPDTGARVERDRWAPCEAERGPRGWPSLERAGTVRSPSATVVHASGSISSYPRQCRGDECVEMPRLAPSRGQVFDHVAFTVDDLDRWEARLARHEVVVLDRYDFGAGRALLIEGPDRLAIELIEVGPDLESEARPPVGETRP
jgi:hypothetical protein